jgi:hypothetical protein
MTEIATMSKSSSKLQSKKVAKEKLSIRTLLDEKILDLVLESVVNDLSTHFDIEVELDSLRSYYDIDPTAKTTRTSKPRTPAAIDGEQCRRKLKSGKRSGMLCGAAVDNNIGQGILCKACAATKDGATYLNGDGAPTKKSNKPPATIPHRNQSLLVRPTAGKKIKNNQKIELLQGMEIRLLKSSPGIVITTVAGVDKVIGKVSLDGTKVTKLTTEEVAQLDGIPLLGPSTRSQLANKLEKLDEEDLEKITSAIEKYWSDEVEVEFDKPSRTHDDDGSESASEIEEEDEEAGDESEDEAPKKKLVVKKPTAKPAVKKPAVKKAADPDDSDEDEAPKKKPATKPAVKPAAKPTTKPVVKPTAKKAADPDEEDEAPKKKPATKPTTKPVVKPTAKPTTKPAVKPAAKKAADPDDDESEEPEDEAPPKKVVKPTTSTKVVKPDDESDDSDQKTAADGGAEDKLKVPKINLEDVEDLDDGSDNEDNPAVKIDEGDEPNGETPVEDQDHAIVHLDEGEDVEEDE